MMRASAENDATATASSGDTIDTWLAVLVRLLDVSGQQRDSIRDEIESHLRERVRDLMIAGRSEAEAIRIAIGELGEVADLARRFTHASKSRTRRTIMNAAVLAFGAVSVATAAVFFNGPQPNSHVSIFNEQPATSQPDESKILEDHTIEARFDETGLEDVLKFLAASSGVDLIIDRGSLDAHGIPTDAPVSLHLSKQRPVSQVLELVAHQFNEPFAWRVHDGILEVAMPNVFDARDVVLASFDVQPALNLIRLNTETMDEAADRLESLVVDYVEPYSWTRNGGDLGELRIVGGRMFVKAPSRFHQPIEWILDQLEQSAQQAARQPALRAFDRTVPSAFGEGVPRGMGGSGMGGSGGGWTPADPLTAPPAAPPASGLQPANPTAPPSGSAASTPSATPPATGPATGPATSPASAEAGPGHGSSGGGNFLPARKSDDPDAGQSGGGAGGK